LFTGRKLLLADDSITIQKVVDLTFADEGMEVTTVGNGEQAIAILEEIAPDIVLADVFMPGRNGYEVCEHIKRDERFRHIPVMLLVGSFEPFDEAEARRVGADDFLTKPFQSIKQLVKKVAALLSGSDDERTTRDLKLPQGAQKLEESSNHQKESVAQEELKAQTADTVELTGEAQEELAAASFNDPGFDDEMIEATPASQFSGAHVDEIQAAPHRARATAPLSTSDFEDAGIRHAAEYLSNQMQSTIQNFKVEEMSNQSNSTGVQPPRPAQMSDAAAADEALLDLGEIEPPGATAEADDFILDLSEEGFAGAPQAASAPPAEMVTQPSELSTSPAMADFDEEKMEAAAQAQAEASQFVASDEGASMEATARTEVAEPVFTDTEVIYEGMQEAPTVPLNETLHAEVLEAGVIKLGEGEAVETPSETSTTANESAATEVEETSAVASPGVQITLDQLSPEAIDAIARRAVEMLSEKVVQEIAWEVVPQLAELLIKRKLEEKQ
jgi:CheY-like chemotaxis protein